MGEKRVEMDPPKQQEEENDIYSVDILEETIMEADEDTVTVKNEPKPTDSKKVRLVGYFLSSFRVCFFFAFLSNRLD